MMKGPWYFIDIYSKGLYAFNVPISAFRLGEKHDFNSKMKWTAGAKQS